jgi:hypothetical protein
VAINAGVPGGRSAASGTSFATAIVSSAMLRQASCTTLRDTAAMGVAVAAKALDLGPKGRDDTFGEGLFHLPRPADCACRSLGVRSDMFRS